MLSPLIIELVRWLFIIEIAGMSPVTEDEEVLVMPVRVTEAVFVYATPAPGAEFIFNSIQTVPDCIPATEVRSGNVHEAVPPMAPTDMPETVPLGMLVGPYDNTVKPEGIGSVIVKVPAPP
jgi:hypothetical protein